MEDVEETVETGKGYQKDIKVKVLLLCLFDLVGFEDMMGQFDKVE